MYECVWSQRGPPLGDVPQPLGVDTPLPGPCLQPSAEPEPGAPAALLPGAPDDSGAAPQESCCSVRLLAGRRAHQPVLGSGPRKWGLGVVASLVRVQQSSGGVMWERPEEGHWERKVLNEAAE